MDWEQLLVDALSKSPAGIFVIVVIGFCVLGIKGYDKLHAIRLQRKEEKKIEDKEKAEKEKKQLDDIIEAKEFREKIDSIISKFPDTTKQIQDLSEKVGNVINEVELSNRNHEQAQAEFMKTNLNFQSELSALKQSVEKINEESRAYDDGLTESLSLIKETLSTVCSKVDVIINGDRDEFRVFIMHEYNNHVTNPSPVSKEDAQTIRIRYIKYRRENGNGWAESFYNSILSCDIEGEENMTVREFLEKQTGIKDEFHESKPEEGSH